MEAGDNLHFDAQGKLLGTGRPGAFAYSAIGVEKVQESAADVRIKARRVALVFHSRSESPSLKKMQYVPLDEEMEITIAVNPADPQALDAALGKIFALSAKDELAAMSPSERQAALATVGSTAPWKAGSPAGGSETHDAGTATPAFIQAHLRNVTPPRLVYTVEPTYPPKAKQDRVTGVCVLSMIVDRNGHPISIRVVRSPNPDLDIAAIIAASKYRFKLAMYEGRAVPVLINVEVNFKIY